MGTSSNDTLGTVVIVNDGTGTKHLANYDVYQFRRNQHIDRLNYRKINPTRTARIEGYSRRAKTPMYLLGAAMEALGYT
jgi:hypothetical protein